MEDGAMKRDGSNSSRAAGCCALEQARLLRVRQGHLNEAVVSERKWQFKTKFRARAYGWRGSSLAIIRLKEAVSEIKAVAKSDPVVAGGGAVALMERIWPAFQDIDTSSGALGTAVARTLGELIPVLIDAPADHSTRSKWLERLFEAVQNDGVEYLAPVEDRWGEIARYPDLINEYADRLIGTVRPPGPITKHSSM